MTDIYNNPGAMLTALHAMVDGLTTNPPPGLTQLAAGGKVSALPALTTELQGYLDLYQAADDALKAYEKAILARDTQAPMIRPRFEDIRTAVKSAIGRKNPDLGKFGMTPAKTPAPLTAEQKVARAAKAIATRLARHTVGPKKKKAIKGLPPAASPPSPPVPVTKGP